MNDNAFQREVLDRLIKLETLLQQQDYKGLNEKVDSLQKEVIQQQQIIESHEEKIKKIEDNNKWLWRTVVAALIGYALTVIFKI